MFRKDKDAIGYWHENYPEENATRQREIISEAVKMLRPGGNLFIRLVLLHQKKMNKLSGG
ncbi:hypothetical protein GCM10025879_04750 [Leuconostoc litchii]|nr:hypothetical protein GCM10025879_04750 [Leuconostoc litchii]